MKISLNRNVTIQSIPAIRATAKYLLDASKIIWKRTQNNSSFPIEYKSIRGFVKHLNKEHGYDVFKKNLFGYKMTKNGRGWIEKELFMLYLNKNDTIGKLIETTVSKINYLKKYHNGTLRLGLIADKI